MIAAKKARVVALTGAIGTGKSTAANLFAELGIPVIDADQLSRELTQPNTEVTREIIQYFGKKYLDAHHQLNRQKLREQIFNVPADKVWLENFLHPKIYALMREKIQLSALKKPAYIMAVIPLLFETGKPDFVDEIWVVDSSESCQLKRIMARDKITEELAKKIMETQCPRAKRLILADKIMSNNSDIKQLKLQVSKIHAYYAARPQ